MQRRAAFETWKTGRGSWGRGAPYRGASRQSRQARISSAIASSEGKRGSMAVGYRSGPSRASPQMRERAGELFAETVIGRTRLDDGAKRLWGGAIVVLTAKAIRRELEP